EVLLETVELRRARDRNDPRLLGEEPRERDLGGRGLLLAADPPEEIDHGLIRLAIFRSESRQGIAKIGFVERGLLVELAGKASSSERAESNEANAEPLQRRQDLGFGPAEPEGVFALQRSARLDRVGAADGVRTRLREPEVPHLALRDEVFDGAR